MLRVIDETLTALFLAGIMFVGLLWFQVPPPTTQTRFIINQVDPGGSVGTYMQFGERLRDAGVLVVVDSECISACSLMVLGIIDKDKVCLTEHGSFGLHMASTDEGPNQEITDRLVRLFYPKIVQDWIKEHGPLTPEVIYMLPEDFKGYFRMCNPSEVRHYAEDTDAFHRLFGL